MKSYKSGSQQYISYRKKKKKRVASTALPQGAPNSLKLRVRARIVWHLHNSHDSMSYNLIPIYFVIILGSSKNIMRETSWTFYTQKLEGEKLNVEIKRRN